MVSLSNLVLFHLVAVKVQHCSCYSDGRGMGKGKGKGKERLCYLI